MPNIYDGLTDYPHRYTLKQITIAGGLYFGTMHFESDVQSVGGAEPNRLRSCLYCQLAGSTRMEPGDGAQKAQPAAAGNAVESQEESWRKHGIYCG